MLIYVIFSDLFRCEPEYIGKLLLHLGSRFLESPANVNCYFMVIYEGPGKHIKLRTDVAWTPKKA